MGILQVLRVVAEFWHTIYVVVVDDDSDDDDDADLALDEFVSEFVAFSLEQVDSLPEKAVLVLKTLEEFVL